MPCPSAGALRYFRNSALALHRPKARANLAAKLDSSVIVTIWKGESASWYWWAFVFFAQRGGRALTVLVLYSCSSRTNRAILVPVMYRASYLVSNHAWALQQSAGSLTPQISNHPQGMA